jgi:hypothetical protein
MGSHAPLSPCEQEFEHGTALQREERKGIEKAFPLYQLRRGEWLGPHKTTGKTSGSLLHKGGFCNGCITKRILILQAFHS